MQYGPNTGYDRMRCDLAHDVRVQAFREANNAARSFQGPNQFYNDTFFKLATNGTYCHNHNGRGRVWTRIMRMPNARGKWPEVRTCIITGSGSYIVQL